MKIREAKDEVTWSNMYNKKIECFLNGEIEKAISIPNKVEKQCIYKKSM